jgi:hypothetical protein
VRITATRNEDLVPWLMEQAERPAKRLRTRRRLRIEELRCHPDLCDRVHAMADGLPGVLARYVVGLPVLVHPNGVVFAIGGGTTWMAVRLPHAAHGAVVRSQWGRRGLEGEWIDVDPWMTDVAAYESVRRLHGWTRAAFEHAREIAGAGPRARPTRPTGPTRRA